MDTYYLEHYALDNMQDGMANGKNVRDEASAELYNLVHENEMLRKRVAKLDEALGDVVDGIHQFDLADMTGLSYERCQEIIDLVETAK